MSNRLTRAQEKIVCELVRLQREKLLDASFRFLPGGYGIDSGFYLSKADQRIPCEADDVKTLCAANMIIATFSDGGDALCSIRAEAADAVRRDFGGSGRHRLLNAVYDLASGILSRPILMSDAMECAELSKEELDSAFLILAKEKKLDGNSGSGKGPVIYLTSDGVRAVQDGERSFVPAGQFIHSLNVHAHDSAINVGSGNTASVHSGQPGAVRTLDQLKEQSDQMLLQHEAIRTVLENLISALSRGVEKNDPSIVGRLTKLMDAGKWCAEFGAAILSTVTAFAQH